jgi:hypothetical protein
VTGDVVSQATVTRQNNVSITGSVIQGATLSPPKVVSREFTFPGGQSVHRPPSSPTITLAPGGYGHLSVHSGSRVILAGSAGTAFYFESVSFEPQSTLEIRTNGALVPIFVRGAFNFKGAFVLQGNPQDLFFGLFGSGTTSLETAISGTMVVPNGTLRFAPAFKEFRGSFFAKAVEAEPDLTLTFVPFNHWGRIFPPVPKAECVTVQNAVTRSARFSYENPLATATVVPRGSLNRVTPTPPPGFEPPTEFLPGSHSYWVPFQGNAVTWELNAFQAVADLTTRRCAVGDFPISQGDPDAPIDPISVSRPSSGVLAGAIADRLPISTSTANGANASVQASFFTGPVPFTIRINQVTVPSTYDLDIQVTLDGTMRERHIGSCGGIGEGCFPGPFPVDQRFSIIPANPDQVSVRIRLIDRGTFSDDVVIDFSFTVDPKTGQSSWGAPCATTSAGWGLCFDFITTAPPVINEYQPALCARFNASFYDSGFGEDHLPGREEQQVPASFAFAALVTSWDGPVWFGFLDEAGCIPENAGFVASDLAFPQSVLDARVTLDFQPAFCRPGAGVPPFSTPPTNAQECLDQGGILWAVNEVTSGFSAVVVNGTLTQGEIDLANKQTTIPIFSGVMDRTRGVVIDGWVFPPLASVILDQSGPSGTPRHDDVSRVAAASTAILNAPDSGIVSGTYHVMANDSCPTSSPNVIGDACVTANRLWLGKGKLGFFDDNLSVTRWKYVTAHEAGHLIQLRAMGIAHSSAYSFSNVPPSCPESNQVQEVNGAIACADPPGTDALCRCDHVDVANKLHCLQSVETPGGAQVEGFAQFYASKIYNRLADNDCTFVYYKEFLDQTCRSDECSQIAPSPPTQYPFLQRSVPPLGVDCANPPRWRNVHCAMPDFGTELDWMAFYWLIHSGSGGAAPLSMADIYGVYTTACAGSCNRDQPWEVLETAAVTLFGAGTTQAIRFANGGRAAGVNRDVD